MATVIDSLVVELGLDASRFTAGQREAVRAADATVQAMLAGGREIESQGKKTNDLLLSFRREAVTSLGLLFGGMGIKEFFTYIMSFDAMIGRVGKTLDMSGTEVGAWAGAIREVGGTTESAVGALQGLSGEMHRFHLTGQSAMLPVLSRLGVSLYDQNRRLKTSGELWLDLAEAVQGMDPGDAVAFLSMIPGANQDMINLALSGRKAMEAALAANRAAAPTPEQIEAGKQAVKNMADLDTAAKALGNSLANLVAPAVTTVMGKLAELFTIWNRSPDSAKGHETVTGGRAATAQQLGRPRHFMEWMRDNFSIDDADRAKWDAIINNWYRNDSPGRAHFAARLAAGNSTPSAANREAFIRRTSAELGIDPEQGMAVAKSEGFFAWDQSKNAQSFIPGEQSFGDFQLHYGGGLGDVFTKQTGLDARDPKNWQAADRWALKYASTHGWNDWHGWRGAPFAGIGGGGAGPRAVGGGNNQTFNVTVNAPGGDGNQIAHAVVGGIRRGISAAPSNGGAH